MASSVQMYKGAYGIMGKPGGYKADYYAAKAPHVQSALATIATKVAARARGDLATVHHKTGMSRVEVEHGAIDWYATLTDSTPEGAPRTAYVEGSTAVLRRAAGLGGLGVKKRRDGRRGSSLVSSRRRRRSRRRTAGRRRR